MQTNTTGRLLLNKKTIAYLQQSEMSAVQGGFTYSLSTGDVCQNSNEAYRNLINQGVEVADKPDNGYECRKLIEDNGTSTLPPGQVQTH